MLSPRRDPCPSGPGHDPPLRDAERDRPMPSLEPSADDPAVRFLIVAAPRTGSTHLRLLLHSHPAVCCHGEVFRAELGSLVGLNAHVPSPLQDRLAAARAADPGGFLMADVLYPGRMRAVGAKILYRTFALDQWRGLLERVVAERELKIVHLVRRNRVKRFLSHFVYTQVTKRTLALSAAEVPNVGRVRVPVTELLADLAAMEAEERRFRTMFSGQQTIEVAYEDVVATGRPEVLDDVQRFLGVAPCVLESPAHKILSDRLCDVIENVAEIEAALRDTPHAWMLSEETTMPTEGGGTSWAREWRKRLTGDVPLVNRKAG